VRWDGLVRGEISQETARKGTVKAEAVLTEQLLHKRATREEA
jgi:hypothetical protein